MNNKSKETKSNNIYIERNLIKSQAFLQLTGISAKVLLFFIEKKQVSPIGRGKKKSWVIVNNGKIVFTYDQAEKKYNISRKTFSRVISELVEYGFIDIARPGIGYARIETLYAMSDRWRKFGTNEFVAVERHTRISHKFPKK